MLGLIIKDILNLSSNKRIFVTLFIMFTFVGFMSNGLPNYLSIYLPILCLMLAISTFSYDESSKWDRYVLALPLSRKDIVRSRYMFSLVLLVLSFLFNILFNLLIIIVFNQPLLLNSILIQPLITIMIVGVIIAIVFPLIYKFGAEKGRLVMIFFSIVIGAGGALLGNLFSDQVSQTEMFDTLIPFLNTYGFYILFILSSLALIGSYHLSLTFYNQKEI